MIQSSQIALKNLLNCKKRQYSHRKRIVLSNWTNRLKGYWEGHNVSLISSMFRNWESLPLHTSRKQTIGNALIQSLCLSLTALWDFRCKRSSKKLSIRSRFWQSQLKGRRSRSKKYGSNVKVLPIHSSQISQISLKWMLPLCILHRHSQLHEQ